MNQNSSHDGAPEEPVVHTAEPSVWPIIVGLAALFVGFALVWWVRARSNQFSGPILGAAVIAVFISIAGWAYDDTKMRRKADRAVEGKGEDSRFTQVVTFAVAGGRLAVSRESGIIRAIDSEDNALRDLLGFLDLRIIVSPATTGPSQVLVETTWSDREGLATYEQTRRSLLDLVAQHSDDVVPGTVQVFDMEVVRDTKEMAVRFGLAPAFTVFGALIVAGFMVGAGLTVFQKNTTVAAGTATAPAGGSTPSSSNSDVVTASDNPFKFDVKTLTLPPNTKVTLTLKNAGAIAHNLHFYDKKGGSTLATGADGSILNGGQSEPITFTTPGAGTYYFQCDIHPDQMNGTLEVKAGAPLPGASPAGGAGGSAAAPASGSAKLIATDNQFDQNTLNATAGQPFTVGFQNNGKIPHNLHFYDKKGGTDLAQGAAGGIASPGQSETLTFTPPAPGTYYFQCDIHPDQMNGKLVVK